MHKAECHVVKITAGTKGDVGHVFFCDDVTTKISIRQIETFATHDETVIFYAHLDGGFGYDFCDVSVNFAVKNEYGLADFDLLGKIVLDGDNVGTVVLLDGGIQN